MAGYMTLNLPEHEQLVSCPYNKAHQVVKHRLGNHLVKCRRSHSSAGMKECMFDSSHVYPLEEIALHQETCPGRLTVELFMATEAEHVRLASRSTLGADSGIMSLQSPVPKVAIHENNDEDWDNMPAVPTYNPKKKVAESDIIRHIQHMTPSQRKQVREEENQRIRAIREKAASESIKPKKK